MNGDRYTLIQGMACNYWEDEPKLFAGANFCDESQNASEEVFIVFIFVLRWIQVYPETDDSCMCWTIQ